MPTKHWSREQRAKYDATMKEKMRKKAGAISNPGEETYYKVVDGRLVIVTPEIVTLKVIR